jgi:hypothetical protein
MRRSLLWALLIYVALDVSLPELPGAFMFDAASSVDSIETGRARLTRTAPFPTPRPDSLVPFLRPDQAPARARDQFQSRQIVRADRRVVNCLPRAVCSLPQPSEDPH